MENTEQKNIRVILGTMGVGASMNQETSKQLLEVFSSYGHSEVDTALMYQGGKTEKVLGAIGLPQDKFSVATKVNPWFKDGKCTDFPQGSLTKPLIKQQMNLCCSNLRMKKIPLLYLHAPDHATPITETLEAINELHKLGKFQEWGVSNYSAWEVVDIYHLCKENGWKPPTVYQGMYNYATRDVERELFPALRRCGMRFYAYNPLAGGLLTGKFKFESEPDSGRYSGKTVWGKRYRDRFWHKPLFDAQEEIKGLLEGQDISNSSVALRWLLHHSQLQDGDGIIVGGSSILHVQENLESIKNSAPLSEDVIQVIDGCWEGVRGVCPPYFR
eukprot:TRINITY_DN12858_c0_g1_i1.p1 TRINITY_DN12858_c0_g1~~TRINITY_DN12858_c0_g1_i1.p1  ORF type:complete len:329 (-),score=65.44 TRINITY_DN12858_c0_g1_i1:23-1009(-)